MIGCQWKNVEIEEKFVYRDPETKTEWCGTKYSECVGLLDHEDGCLLTKVFAKNDMVLIKHRRTQ